MSDRVHLSTERYHVAVYGRRRVDMDFRTLAVARAFADHAMTLLGARRIRIFKDDRLLEDRVG